MEFLKNYHIPHTTYNIYPLASDDNPGTETEPFLTVQKGINTACVWDTYDVSQLLIPAC